MKYNTLDRLKALPHAQYLSTKTHLQAAWGVSKTSFYAKLNGKSQITALELEKAAIILGCTMQELINIPAQITH